MKNITKRDFLCFVLGFFVYFCVATIADWEKNVEAFKEGYRDGTEANINA